MKKIKKGLVTSSYHTSRFFIYKVLRIKTMWCIDIITITRSVMEQKCLNEKQNPGKDNSVKWNAKDNWYIFTNQQV